MTGAIVVVLAALSVCLVAGAKAAGSGWAVAQIGEPGFTPLAVNDAGVVAGYVGVWPDYRAAVWSDGTTTFLATPENTVRSIASGINTYGQVVGQVDLVTEEFTGQEAVMWDASGEVSLLGFLPGGSFFSVAQDINDDGLVVGVTGTGGGYVAFQWDGDGPIEALPVPSGMTNAFAVGVNNNGQIVGSASAMFQPDTAVLWDDGVAEILDPLAEGAAASAADINDLGQIVGNSATTAPPWLVRHAVLWESGVPVDLGSLGGSFGMAQGVSSDGRVVGLMTDSASVDHAFVWKDSKLVTLDPLPDDAESVAADVNGLGQVVGTSGPYAGTRGAMWTLTKTPQEQVADLIALVESYDLVRLGTSLTDKLVTVQQMLEANKPRQACENLDSFLNQVQAQTGKGLTVEQAKALTDGAQAIKDAIGC